jgi:hypothetical protein
MDDLMKMCKNNVTNLLQIYHKEKDERKQNGFLYLASDGTNADVIYITEDIIPEDIDFMYSDCFKDTNDKIVFLLHDKPSNTSTYLNITEKEGSYTELKSDELDSK